MPYIGKQPTKIPLTSDDIADGAISSADIADLDAAKLTGTVNNARISLDAAEIPNLDAAKITSGDIALARLGNAPATDLTPVRQDIAMLALYNAVSDNRAAYNLPFSFIDQFEDDTGLTTQTDVDRVTSGEYVASVYSTLTTPAYITGDRRSRITVTQSGWTIAQGTITHILDGTISEVSGTAILGTAYGVDNAGDYFNFDFGSAVNVSEFKWYRNATTTIGAWQFSGSANADHSSSVNLGSTFTLGGTASGAHPGIPQVVTEMSANTDTYRYYRITGTGGSSTGNNWDSEIEFKEATGSSVANATGTLISDTQTSPTATTKMSGVILYKDNGSGASTLGTHLKIYLSANGGSNWTEVAAEDFGAVTPLFSTGVKMVRLAEQTVTSGTTPVMKAVWASQASGTLETQLHGWAMNY